MIKSYLLELNPRNLYYYLIAKNADSESKEEGFTEEKWYGTKYELTLVVIPYQ